MIRRKAVEDRQKSLLAAQRSDELLFGRASEIEEEIGRMECVSLTPRFRIQCQRCRTNRSNLLPRVHRLRARHVQTLDAIFPIQPLSPASLLYSILGVPLPIPVGAKEPAPPLSLPASSLPDGCAKVDERTTAAALGYIAMVVQLLGGLGGATGGVPYPVTCAGSRSLVRDVVSVMAGQRS